MDLGPSPGSPSPTACIPHQLGSTRGTTDLATIMPERQVIFAARPAMLRPFSCSD
jgi:hypothetical protein